MGYDAVTKAGEQPNVLVHWHLNLNSWRALSLGTPLHPGQKAGILDNAPLRNP